MSKETNTQSEVNALQTEITQIVADTLSDSDFITQIIKKKIENAVQSAIDSMFDWGDAKHAIEAKLKSVMIPVIEAYDFSKYVQKLDVIMDELLHSPNIICNNKILSNFKTIMCPPDVKTITLDQFFTEYCNFVAANIDTDGRDIDYDGGDVAYEAIECIMTSENITSTYMSSQNDEHYRLSFHTGEDDAKTEYNESLDIDIELRRWHWMPPNEYSVRIAIDPHRLKDMSDFESYVYSLGMANINIKLVSDENLKSDIYKSEFVTPDKTPEPTYT